MPGTQWRFAANCCYCSHCVVLSIFIVVAEPEFSSLRLKTLCLEYWLWNALLFGDLQRYISLCSFHCPFPCFLHFSYSAGVSTFARLCSPLSRNPSQSFLPCVAFGPIPSVLMWVCVFRTLQRVLLCRDWHREWVGAPVELVKVS